jgi:hypothetical protein
MLKQELKCTFSGGMLKWIAIISMLVNHFGDTILYGIIMNAPYDAFSNKQFSIIYNCYTIFHAIGRIAMPIFCFLIVEGFLHTHNVKKYLLRLAIFAVISEIPYDFAITNSLFDVAQQNVFFTLTTGLLVLIIIDKYKQNKVVIMFVIFIATSVTYLLKFDGSYYGILMMVLFYLLKEKKLLKSVSIFVLQIAIIFIFQESFDLNSFFALIPLILIYFYNGKRGMKLKYFFYVFYPTHLLILGLVTKFIVIPMIN